MLRAVDLGVLEAYSQLIQRFQKLYGAVVWINLYQADVRARLERLPKLRLSLLARHNAAVAAGSTTTLYAMYPSH